MQNNQHLQITILVIVFFFLASLDEHVFYSRLFLNPLCSVKSPSSDIERTSLLSNKQITFTTRIKRSISSIFGISGHFNGERDDAPKDRSKTNVLRNIMESPVVETKQISRNDLVNSFLRLNEDNSHPRENLSTEISIFVVLVYIGVVLMISLVVCLIRQYVTRKAQ